MRACVRVCFGSYISRSRGPIFIIFGTQACLLGENCQIQQGLSPCVARYKINIEAQKQTLQFRNLDFHWDYRLFVDWPLYWFCLYIILFF